ncbi:MAG: SRPBCC family protein [Sphingobium sp.]|nr:SRPBCC family protein [Sphingobium sp.]
MGAEAPDAPIPQAPPAPDDRPPMPRDRATAAYRIAAAFGVALAFALSVYTLLEVTRPSEGVIGFSFLLFLPAALCAFIAYVADPWADKKLTSYLMVPVILLIIVILVSVPFLKEGTICIVMLSPLWLGSGMMGASLTYWVRKRIANKGRTYCAALLLLPIMAMQVEPRLPVPVETASVSRSVIIHAKPAEIWPLLEGVPNVRSDEGRWNISQDVIGIPRPVGASLVGNGIGADRFARWQQGIAFRERITQWDMHRHIGWDFLFDDMTGWDITDRHLMPDSPYFRVESGGYRLRPIGPNRTEVTLETQYRMRTHLNGYASLWGELILGDLENNVLAVIRQRAEGHH